MMRSLILGGILTLFLATGALCAEFSADTVMKSVAGTHTGKIYFKNDDISRTELMGMISIFKRPSMYQLFPDSRKYTVTDISEISKKTRLRTLPAFGNGLRITR